MFYVYVLKEQNSNYLYIGYTGNLERRLEEHKKHKSSYHLIYYEAYLSEKDARNREGKLKNYGSTIGHLKRRIKNSLEDRKGWEWRKGE